MKRTFFARRPRNLQVDEMERDLRFIASEFSGHVTLSELQDLRKKGASTSEIYDAACLLASWITDRSISHIRYFSLRGQQWYLSDQGGDRDSITLELVYGLMLTFGQDTASMVRDEFFPEWLELDASLIDYGELHRDEFICFASYIAGRADRGTAESSCSPYSDDLYAFDSEADADHLAAVGSYISQLNFGREMMATTNPR